MQNELLEMVVLIRKENEKRPLYSVEHVTAKTFNGKPIEIGKDVEILLREGDTTPTRFLIKDIKAWVFAANRDFVLELYI